MKWFKHYSDANLNGKLEALEAECDLWGYACYWKVLERVAFSWKIDQPEPILTLATKKWRNFLGISQKKWKTFTEICEETNLFTTQKIGHSTTIHIPKLKEIRDESMKKLQKDSGNVPEQGGNYSGQNTPPRGKREEGRGKSLEEEIKSPPISPKGDERDLKSESQIVLDRLNENCGKRFTSTEFIMTRMRVGKYTVEECLTVLDFKAQDEFFQRSNWQHYNAETIFRKSNFPKYLEAAKAGNGKYVSKVKGDATTGSSPKESFNEDAELPF